MRKPNLDLLYRIMKLEQCELKKYLKSLLTKYGYHPISLGGALYAEGTLPVVLVSHMDIVPLVPTYIQNKNGVLSAKGGLGADDRAGIYSILHLLEKGYRPTIIFTEDEEIGGVGARKFVNAKVEIPANIKMFIELDRRGANDCVFYDCDNVDFEEYIESFGFKTAWGSFTDISTLCPHYGIAGVNLSIGYYNEHTPNEILVLSEMMLTIKRVESIFNNLPKDAFEFIEVVWQPTKAYGSYAKLDYSKYVYKTEYDAPWDEPFHTDKADLIELVTGLVLLDSGEIIELDLYNEAVYMDTMSRLYDWDLKEIQGVYANNEFVEMGYDDVMEGGKYALV